MGKLSGMRDAWLRAQARSLQRSKEVLGAAMRQGAHELGNAFYGHGTVAQGHPEYGMPWTRLPSQVADGLDAGDHGAGTTHSHQAPSGAKPEPNSPEPREPEIE